MFSRALLITSLALANLLQAEAVKDREGAVRQDRAKLELDARWNYNNVEQAFAEAKKTGKPVLLVLRCVPCLACMGIDTGVLMASGDLTPLLDKFVCVRLINCNALDMARFQFDYDLSFSALFLNADGTTYGRYGSWKHQKNSQETALEGLKKAMEAALMVHSNYPTNKAELTGKQPVPQPFKTPIEMPELGQKYKAQLDWDGKVASSCVHCHMIGSALQTWHRQQKKPMPEELIYPFPEPETIGLSMLSDQIARVESVTAGSISEKAGIKAGDDIVSFAGQLLISIADVSWALHRTANEATVPCVVKRDGKDVPLSLTLPAGWRRKSHVTERATIWPERGMVLGGMRVESHEGEGIGLKIKGVGQFGMHAAAKKAGFKEGDILLSVDGITSKISEPDLIGHLFDHHQAGERVTVKLKRGAEILELQLPMQ